MKRFPIVLTVVSLVVALVSIAAAPMAAGNATLTSAVYVDGKGIVFTFHVDGKLSRSELKGSVKMDGGGNYGLDCVQVDDSRVKCTASQAIAGANVLVTFGGSGFWTKAPNAPLPAKYCYDIYDWPLALDESEPFEWVNYGTYCQDTPASYGEIITWYNPDYEHEYDYEFLPESPDQDWCPFDPKFGDAYYYPDCAPY